MPAEPWRDLDLSCPDRVMLYMSAHPQEAVRVADLYRGGVEEPHSTIRAALGKLREEGDIQRVGTGRYQWKSET